MASFALPVVQTLAVKVVDQVSTHSSVLTGRRVALVHVYRKSKKKQKTTSWFDEAGRAGRGRRTGGEGEERGRGRGLTVLAGGAVPASGADALELTDFIDAGSSVQAGGALTVVYI